MSNSKPLLAILICLLSIVLLAVPFVRWPATATSLSASQILEPSRGSESGFGKSPQPNSPISDRIGPFPSNQIFDTYQQDDLRAVQRRYNDKIRPLLNQYCGECHQGDGAEAEFNLDAYSTLDQLLNARKKWKKVLVRISAHEMPPADSLPIPESDHQAVLQWIEHLLTSVDCTDINPGRVTIRRLNRIEYKNTIRDLVGIDYQPADFFPGDDVGYGFDNIADVLSLPPILMEKYLHAAEQITMEAIVDPSIPKFKETVHGNRFETTRGSSHRNQAHILTTQGTIKHKIRIPESGTYEIEVRSFQNRAGDEPAKMSVGVNGKSFGSRSIRGTPDNPVDHKFSVRLIKGTRSLEVSFLNDFYRPAENNRKSQDRNLHLVQLTIQGPLGKLPPSQRKLIPRSPDDATDQRVAARQAINVFASRAYRRRVTPGELGRLMELYDQAQGEGECFDLSIRFVFQAVLVSPHFLYRIESPTSRGQSNLLSEFELSTRLSYFIWSTMPDGELFKLASNNGLRNNRTYRAQVKRMLDDPRSDSIVENFASQWLQLRHLESVTPDPDLFPGTDEQLLEDMATETKMLIADLIRRDASILELLQTDYTFLNQRLAEHYGIEGVQGERFRKVSAEQSGRFGLMTQASILTLTSNPTRTSPVKRGKWIMENLLGEEPPQPDPSVMQIEDQPELHGTLRQKMEQHRADPNCAACHVVMDQLGFALENYDAVGRWRDSDGTHTIDASGLLPDGTTFDGAKELQYTLSSAMRKKFVRCLTEKMLIYALGRGLEYFDECTVDKIIERIEPGQYRFSELIMAIATSDPFLKQMQAEADAGVPSIATDKETNHD